ncbi:MAG: hypothetical protein ACLRZ9_07060 [Eubacterium sp.]
MNLEEKTVDKETQVLENNNASETNADVTDEKGYGNLEVKESSNVITGIIGALIGSLLGVGVWIIIYLSGNMAEIAGWLIVFFAIKGYKILGHTLDKKGIIICSIISLLMVLAAHHLSCTIVCYRELKNYIDVNFIDAFKLLPEVISAGDDGWKGYFSELRNGYLFALACGVTLMIKKYIPAK